MTATYLAPSPIQKFWDNNGQPLAYGLVSTYAAGSTTPIATYTDSTGNSQNTNPIVLNARGECSMWLLPNVAYKLVVADSLGNSIPGYPVDNIVNAQLITLYGGVDTGSTNAYILTFTANFSAYQDGIVIYWIPSHNNTAGSTINVNGLGVVSILNQDGSALYANELQANQTSVIMYKGGSFLLLTPSFIASNFLVTQLTGAVNLTPSTVTTLTFNTVAFNPQSAFNGGTGIFTANTAGIFTFSASLFIQNNSVSNGVLNAIYFSQNNATSGVSRADLGYGAQGQTLLAGGNPIAISGSASLVLAKNDTVRIKADVGAGFGGGGSLVMGIGSSFSGNRIG